MAFRVPEQYRLRQGPLASGPGHGNNGAFILPPKIGNRGLYVIASDGAGFEHVSVHCAVGKKLYTPTWAEMCHVKDLFWEEEDTVMQLHPARSSYVNYHEHTLYLWRPIGREIPAPPSILVGPKTTDRSTAMDGER